MGTDLMGASGQQFDLHEGHVLRGPEDAVLRLDGLGTRPEVLVDIDPVLLLILPQIALQEPLSGLRRAVDGTEVELVDLPVFHLLVQHTERLRVLRRQDDAAGVAVDAVDEGRCEGLLRLRVVLPFFIEVPLDPADERVHVLPVVRVCQKAHRFVEDQNVLIFKEDVQVRPRMQEVVGRLRLFKELVIDVQVQYIALGQAGGDLRPFAVDLDAFLSDVFIEKGLRQVRQVLREELVEALPRVILPYCQLFHSVIPSHGSVRLCDCPSSGRR